MATRGNLEVHRKGRSASVQRSEGGDERGGWEVAVDKVDRLVHVKLHGVWRLAVAQEFCTTVLETARAFGGKPWAIIADSTHFGAQAPEISRLRQETMAKLKGLGCEKIAAVVSTVIYSMQFKRITEESHVGGAVFNDEQAALDWIRSDDK
jgi:hypothetical protein